MTIGDKIINIRRNKLKNMMYEITDIKDFVVVIVEDGTREWAICDLNWIKENFVILKPITFNYKTTPLN